MIAIKNFIFPFLFLIYLSVISLYAQETPSKVQLKEDINQNESNPKIKDQQKQSFKINSIITSRNEFRLSYNPKLISSNSGGQFFSIKHFELHERRVKIGLGAEVGYIYSSGSDSNLSSIYRYTSRAILTGLNLEINYPFAKKRINIFIENGIGYAHANIFDFNIYDSPYILPGVGIKLFPIQQIGVSFAINPIDKFFSYGIIYNPNWIKNNSFYE